MKLMDLIKMSFGARFHGCSISAVGPTWGTLMLVAQCLAEARAVTAPFEGHCLLTWWQSGCHLDTRKKFKGRALLC